jgi:hypothetical protein
LTVSYNQSINQLINVISSSYLFILFYKFICIWLYSSDKIKKTILIKRNCKTSYHITQFYAQWQ